VKKAGDFYTTLGAVVTSEFSIFSEHCQPTLSFGNDCFMLESPFINQCKYDGAGKALKALYGPTLRSSGTWKLNNLVTISQSSYFPNQQPVVGLGDTAYLYVPDGNHCNFLKPKTFNAAPYSFSLRKGCKM
jgi:hypothetical protein